MFGKNGSFVVSSENPLFWLVHLNVSNSCAYIHIRAYLYFSLDDPTLLSMRSQTFKCAKLRILQNRETIRTRWKLSAATQLCQQPIKMLILPWNTAGKFKQRNAYFSKFLFIFRKFLANKDRNNVKENSLLQLGGEGSFCVAKCDFVFFLFLAQLALEMRVRCAQQHHGHHEKCDHEKRDCSDSLSRLENTENIIKKKEFFTLCHYIIKHSGI